jgi:fumarylacetoacetate (FAA) hydrolase family protein
MIKIFRGQHDYVLQNSRQTVRVVEFSFDELFQSSDPADYASHFFDPEAVSSSGDPNSIRDQPWLAIGNDMSSRSIEGENPLYLPQAKVYRGSCAIGPCLVIGDVVRQETEISISIRRNGDEVFSGSTVVSQIKRSFDELAEFLFRENEFPNGAYLMTGTGVVPDSDFTLASGDQIRIKIESLGVLENAVE